ncbi:DUF6772 family protein [Sodalis-like endosymbiont of Proechinophthirus fluctus]|uniref:DUF6772 family protein n=1 Tax=Sodalis-like endosymbiont of Proechinophthirus fluctus TaxID=1462730 RepID=UPI0034E94FDD
MYNYRLTKYDPLEKIITFDDFNHGHNSYLDLRQNFLNPVSRYILNKSTLFIFIGNRKSSRLPPFG